MDILDLFQAFQTQEQAVEYLEKVRWHGEPACPYCNGNSVGRHASGDRASHRWQCHSCTRAFAATVGTIFHGTHIPLRSWFLVIALMLKAKKSTSSYQIARDLGMRRPTVWRMMHRIRTAIASDSTQANLLRGIVEADGIRGGQRKTIKRDDDRPNKGGSSIKKASELSEIKHISRKTARSVKQSDSSPKVINGIEAVRELVEGFLILYALLLRPKSLHFFNAMIRCESVHRSTRRFDAMPKKMVEA